MRTIVVGLMLCGLLSAGCGDDDGRIDPDAAMGTDAATPGTDAATDETDAATSGTDAATDAAPGTDAATPGPDAAAGCASDDDCRRFSSQCDGCECLPLLESEPDPECEGTVVACLIDPCEMAGPVRCNMATGACELE